jgi:hypothetical protein
MLQAIMSSPELSTLRDSSGHALGDALLGPLFGGSDAEARPDPHAVHGLPGGADHVGADQATAVSAATASTTSNGNQIHAGRKARLQVMFVVITVHS